MKYLILPSNPNSSVSVSISYCRVNWRKLSHWRQDSNPPCRTPLTGWHRQSRLSTWLSHPVSFSTPSYSR